MDAFWPPFWPYFGTRNRQKNALDFRGASGAILGAPGHPPTAKTMIFIGGLFKIENPKP